MQKRKWGKIYGKNGKVNIKELKKVQGRIEQIARPG